MFTQPNVAKLTLFTIFLYAGSVNADEFCNKNNMTQLEGNWVGDLTRTLTVDASGTKVDLMCKWVATLDLFVSGAERVGDSCEVMFWGSLDIANTTDDIEPKKSNPNIKLGKFAYCHWSVEVPIKKTVVQINENLSSSTFDLVFDFPPSHTNEEIGIFAMENIDSGKATFSENKKIILDAGELNYFPR